MRNIEEVTQGGRVIGWVAQVAADVFSYAIRSTESAAPPIEVRRWHGAFVRRPYAEKALRENAFSVPFEQRGEGEPDLLDTFGSVRLRGKQGGLVVSRASTGDVLLELYGPGGFFKQDHVGDFRLEPSAARLLGELLAGASKGEGD